MCGMLGGENGGATNCVGEYGASRGPNTAIATMARKMPTPILVRRMRHASRRIMIHSEGRRSACTTGGSTSSESLTMISGVLIAGPS